MKNKDILFSIENSIAMLLLNRPERLNGLNDRMREELSNIALRVNNDDSIKVLLITGAGKGFCSGADVFAQSGNIKKREYPSRNSMVSPVGIWGHSLAHIRKPVIGAINGVAAGSGLSLALLCDIRIAAENARFSAAWVKRGLAPDIGASYLLPLFVGVPKALEIIMLGKMIDAKEALSIGLVSQVVSENQLMSTAGEIASELANGPSVAIELAKLAVTRHLRREYEDQTYFETFAQKVCYNTEDHAEGVRSFIEKRPPQFKGR
ncbi:enoyl-CoA hydratase/isomerase family protein [Chloroflexota bacterium]